MKIRKILYIAKVNNNDKSSFGVVKKINDQKKIFQKHFDIDILSYNEKGILLNKYLIKKNKNMDKYSIRKEYYKILKKILNNYDSIYFRNIIADHYIIDIIKNFKGIKILEIPTNIEALKQETNILSRIFINLYQKKFLNLFHYIFINGNSGSFEKLFSERLIKIDNGIDVNSIKIKKKNKDNKNLNILSVAHNSKWHGYDRVIKGMYEYNKKNPNKEVYYHCVGEGPELENLKNLVKELKLEKYVIFHGTKTGEELDEIVDDSDIAFGSLANHRKGLYVDSALKNREYCARGIPFVIASDDPDFPKSFPYVYRISQDETPVNIEKVIEFYDSIKNENYIEEMRKYAEENLTWDIKMKPVIEKIKELAKGKKESNK